jgi:hypothetical protein
MTTPFTPGLTSTGYDCVLAFKQLVDHLPSPLAILPIKPREKRPLISKWPEIRAQDKADENFRNLFTGQNGVGLLCGEPSGRLCFLDVDQDDLTGVCEELLPLLKAAPKIRGARGYKWLLRASSTIRGFGIKSAEGQPIGQFLSERQQGVIAGFHPNGSLYSWVRWGVAPIVTQIQLKEIFLSRLILHD